MKPPSSYFRFLTLLTSLLWVATFSGAQSIPIWIGQGVTVEVADIRASNVSEHTIKVTYHNEIDVSTLDSGDVWVVSPNGFNGFAEFKSYEEIKRGWSGIAWFG